MMWRRELPYLSLTAPNPAWPTSTFEICNNSKLYFLGFQFCSIDLGRAIWTREQNISRLYRTSLHTHPHGVWCRRQASCFFWQEGSTLGIPLVAIDFYTWWERGSEVSYSLYNYRPMFPWKRWKLLLMSKLSICRRKLSCRLGKGRSVVPHLGLQYPSYVRVRKQKHCLYSINLLEQCRSAVIVELAQIKFNPDSWSFDLQ